MRKSKKKEKSSNLRIGFYFGFLVIFIIIISLVFKIFDTVKKSKYDGGHYFTVAVLNQNNTELISVSPDDGKLKKLTIQGKTTSESLKSLGIPFEGVVTTRNGFSSNTKSYFTKILFNRSKTKSNLTVIDLIQLSLFAQKVSGENIVEDSASVKDPDGISKIATTWFKDPVIQDEDVSIQITNTTGAQGLGNKFARQISNIGSNVVLVNTSQDSEEKSRIYYKKDSHTVKKLSKMLGIQAEKKEMNSISDITIIIGEDKADF